MSPNTSSKNGDRTFNTGTTAKMQMSGNLDFLLPLIIYSTCMYIQGSAQQECIYKTENNTKLNIHALITHTRTM